MLYLTRNISNSIDKVKRRVVKILRFGRSDVQTAFEANSFGLDSNAPKNLIAIYGETNKKGKNVIVGYINIQQLAALGEFRIFSTNPTGVSIMTSIWLKNDGTMEIGGSLNHLTQFEGLLKAFNQLQAEFNAHTHVSNGAPAVPQSTADITSARATNLKTA